MKQIYTILFCVLAVSAALAQKTRVTASSILKQIDEGRKVEYRNVEIVGKLDLTDLANKRLERSSSNFFGDDNETYESNVDVLVSFTNCTFQDDVLAYYHIDSRNETHIAHFEKDVVFSNCIFLRASEFKYSEFNGAANFAGCVFDEEANFKYAEFSSGPQFSNVKFDRGADFKYTEFPRETSFEKATFHGLANFKYSEFRTPLNMEGVDFRGSEDFKYTKVDGRSFTSYLLSR